MVFERRSKVGRGEVCHPAGAYPGFPSILKVAVSIHMSPWMGC